jgi:hypothetical protein
MRPQAHQRTRIDQHGQVIIEPEENLSDKEIYPHMKIPAIGKFNIERHTVVVDVTN